MAIVLPDARELSDECWKALRVRAVHGCALGSPRRLLACAAKPSARVGAYTRDGSTDPRDRTGTDKHGSNPFRYWTHRRHRCPGG